MFTYNYVKIARPLTQLLKKVNLAMQQLKSATITTLVLSLPNSIAALASWRIQGEKSSGGGKNLVHNDDKGEERSMHGNKFEEVG